MKAFKPPLLRLPKHDQFEYRPRYYDPDKEEREQRQDEKRIRFQRTSRQRHSGSHLLGQFRRTRFVQRTRQTAWQRFYKMALLLGIAGAIYGFYVHDLNAVITLVAVFILLILFIRETNKL